MDTLPTQIQHSSYPMPPLPRLATEVIINSDTAGLKNHLMTHVKSAKCFGRIEQKEPGRTHLSIQGHPYLLKPLLSSLKQLLSIQLNEDMNPRGAAVFSCPRAKRARRRRP